MQSSMPWNQPSYWREFRIHKHSLLCKPRYICFLVGPTTTLTISSIFSSSCCMLRTWRQQQQYRQAMILWSSQMKVVRPGAFHWRRLLMMVSNDRSVHSKVLPLLNTYSAEHSTKSTMASTHLVSAWCWASARQQTSSVGLMLGQCLSANI